MTRSRAGTLVLLEDLQRQLTALVAATADANVDDEHDPEGTTIAFERAQLAQSITVAQERLAATDAAVQQIRDGSYGRCAECGALISSARLEARPTARRCIDCARRTN